MGRRAGRLSRPRARAAVELSPIEGLGVLARLDGRYLEAFKRQIEELLAAAGAG